ncbi:MAG: glycogen synthase [Chloroflexi bacterium]|nr:glycogen synthase [Chloroflexota bacterium]
MRILYAAAEVSPWSKVGGLADVAGALPKALGQLGHDIRVITPAHQPAEGMRALGPFTLPFMGREERVVLWEGKPAQGVTIYFVECAPYFGKRPIYGEPDDLLRYLLFSQVVVSVPKWLDWLPEILHCNDWHTAPAIPGLRNRASGDTSYRGIASVYTIHNLGYRGPNEFVDFMVQGIYYADVVSTVSPTYAQEILTPEYGAGLEGLLQSRRDRLFGILNGIDVDVLDPSHDQYLAATFAPGRLGERAKNKAALQARVGLAQEPQTPLIGMVSRLADQKGFDLLAEVIEPLLEQEHFQLVILGMGEAKYEQHFRGLAERHPTQVAAVIAFDEPLAQLIYGGSDFFLMPSRYEPCGLGQLIAMRYGSIPVVRRTGGLADTVEDCDAELAGGTGFVFYEYRSDALAETLRRAITAYRQWPERWQQLVERAMAKDFSWRASASQYAEMYKRALGFKAG